MLTSERLERRQLLAGDVQIRFEFTDTSDNVVPSLSVGENYRVQAFVKDIQAVPDGLFRAYFDLNYDPSLASFGTPITPGSSYNLAPGGSTSTPGLVDEVGGTDTDAFPPTDRAAEFLLFTVPFTANAPGSLSLTIDNADTPSRAIQLFDLRQIPATEVDLVGTSIEIDSSIIISPTTGLQTSEAGATASFTVRLGEQPTGNVSFNLSSNDTTEGTINTSSVSFNTINWNTPQTITITGADDNVADGPIDYSIITSAATSSDSRYSGVNPPDVSVTNADDGNDIVGVLLDSTGPLTVAENGTRTFTIRLTSEPTAPVTIGLSSDIPTQASVSPSSVSFDAGNWNQTQTITISGVDDDVVDGDTALTILTAAAQSTDAGYSGFNADDVSVIVADNDTAGVIVTPPASAITGEDGTSTTFTLRLNSEPTSPVSISLVSSRTDEGTVNPATVEFNAGNWDQPRTVTVTGANDDIDDGNVVYSIVTESSSSDPNYNGINVADVTLTNQDDGDTAGLIVDPTGGLTTTEATGAQRTDTFSIRLASQPTADVVVSVASNDPSEGTASPASLTFTSANWDSERTITVTGVDDPASDGDMTYAVELAASSSDPKYNSLPLASASVTNIDNDPPGITVNRTTGLITSEAGNNDNFTVRLNTQPAAPVTITATSNDTGEGTVSPAQLTFNAENWDQPQPFVLTGVDDALQDGDVDYTVSLAVTSSDANYNGLDAPTVNATNRDNEVAVTIDPVSGLTTDEDGGQATFTIVLDDQPTSNVTIDLSSSDNTEGTVNPASVTFTTSNWDSPRTITVTGQDDAIDDGSVGYSILTAPIISDDIRYGGFDPVDIGVTNQSLGDTAGITIDAAASLTTTEAGSTATFTVVLDSEPTSAVTIDVASSNAGEGTATPSPLVFDDTNWDQPQTVTITGVDESIDDGDANYNVQFSVTSDDAKYNAQSIDSLSVTNTDDDTAAVVLSRTSGLSIGEDGTSDSFTVRLDSEPLSDVTISVVSSNTDEGTVNPSSLTFTAANWDQSQAVTLTGVDDEVKDGDVALTINLTAASSDPNYSGISISPVSATNSDNETPVTISTPSSTTTDESGATATFTIVLDEQPTADVTIGLSSSDTSEATVDQSLLTFTDQNWNIPQTVTFTGVDDAIDDGDVSYQIITAATQSSDLIFNDLNPIDISLTNLDDADTAGVSVTPPAGTTTTEAGGVQTFQVVLDSEPTADVTIAVASSLSTEGIASPSTLTFTAANWNQPQDVTVTGQDDDVDDDDQTYDIEFTVTSDDPKYSSIAVDGLALTNLDDDMAGVTIDPAGNLLTSEDGTTDQFTVVLDSEPTGDVTITFSSSDETEATVDPTVLTFTSANWDQAQIVTLAGVDDELEDDHVDFTVGASIASDDPKYAAITIPAITATNLDDEVGVRFTPIAGLETLESGTTTFFDVVLNREPTDTVTFDLSSSDTDEVTLSHSQLVFTTGNWDTPQRVTATGVDDTIVDGDKDVAIATSPVVSDDPRFSGFDPRDLTIINRDDDSATLNISGAMTSQVEGTAGSTTAFTFTVELTGDVENGVTIDHSTSDGTATAGDDYVDNDSTLTFTGASGQSQQITLLVNHDNIVEEDEQLQLALANLVAANDSIRDRITITGSPITLTIENDDSATLTLAGSSSVAEGTSATSGMVDYSVTLSAPVQGGVTLAYATADGAAVAGEDFEATTGTLVFTGDAGAQTVSVPISRDNKVEIDETFTFSIGPISGGSATILSEISLVNPSLTTTLVNDDSAVVTLVPLAATNEGTAAEPTPFEFQVELSAPVQGALTIPFNVIDGTATLADNDFAPSSGTVTFADATTASQTITVSVAADDRVEFTESFTVQLGDPAGPDAAILSAVTVEGSPQTGTIVNDDFPRLLLSPLAPTDTEGDDGDTTAFTFMVTLTDAVNDPDGFQLNYTTDDGTAVAGNDYVDNDGTLSFAGTAGETKTITIMVHSDNLVEGQETFALNLRDFVGLASTETVLIPESQAIATIIDDDETTISLDNASVTLAEGTGTDATEFVYTVTLSNPIQSPFSIPVTTVDGSATAASGDYQAIDSSLAFAGTAGETQTIRVQVAADNIVEADESFQLNFGSISGIDTNILNRVTVTLPTATGNITDDDSATISIGDISRLESASGPMTFDVSLSAPVQGGFTLPYATADGTATIVDNDYTSASGSLSLSAAGSTSINVTIANDNRIERDESFLLNLGTIAGVPASVASRITIAGSTATGTITNDDTATIRFVDASSSVAEIAGTHSIDVRLDAGAGGVLSEPITVAVSALGSSTTTAEDFTLTTPAITFPAGSSTGDVRTVTINLADDGSQEPVETLALGITIDGDGIGGAVTLGSPSQHAIAISDDPRTASLSGSVWVDADGNSVAGSGEMMLSGVTIRLNGTDRQGSQITATTSTDAAGNYRFGNLPGGTYTISQVQPVAFHEGSTNVLSGITLAPGEARAALGFSEHGMKAARVSHGRILARPIHRDTVSTTLDSGIRVERNGTQVTIVGTEDRDIIKVTPAPNSTGQHRIEVNGEVQTYNASEINLIRLDGGGGDDDLEIADTPGNDRLSTSIDQAILETPDARIEAIAIEFIEATSAQGGNDQSAGVAPIDYLLRLRGDWN